MHPEKERLWGWAFVKERCAIRCLEQLQTLAQEPVASSFFFFFLNMLLSTVLQFLFLL